MFSSLILWLSGRNWGVSRLFLLGLVLGAGWEVEQCLPLTLRSGRLQSIPRASSGFKEKQPPTTLPPA